MASMEPDSNSKQPKSWTFSAWFPARDAAAGEIEDPREPLIHGDGSGDSYSVAAAILPFLFPAIGGLLYGYDIGATSGAKISLQISASHAAVIEPYDRDLIHTGLRIEILYGYYGRLASRSGLAWKTGIEVGADVIDSDYRGEVQVLLFNRTNLPQQQKIAQLILEKIAIPEVYEVPHLSYT
ncbi:hypothetical protein ZIOFF_018873 [Zingiber officinale]|uniref:Deoxyuridine 5'-triphosphate nucleotidohydrolase n=1 Tax=Zingiber officinale TaxID=94328 RepID=A0A8J5HQW8_ZINOF|nr:hypothetical protein ZIOFF_018873 [Zingiber officinale]